MRLGDTIPPPLQAVCLSSPRAYTKAHLHGGRPNPIRYMISVKERRERIPVTRRLKPTERSNNKRRDIPGFDRWTRGRRYGKPKWIESPHPRRSENTSPYPRGPKRRRRATEARAPVATPRTLLRSILRWTTTDVTRHSKEVPRRTNLVTHTTRHKSAS